jgi:hypothetical protein
MKEISNLYTNAETTEQIEQIHKESIPMAKEIFSNQNDVDPIEAAQFLLNFGRFSLLTRDEELGKQAFVEASRLLEKLLETDADTTVVSLSLQLASIPLVPKNTRDHLFEAYLNFVHNERFQDENLLKMAIEIAAYSSRFKELLFLKEAFNNLPHAKQKLGYSTYLNQKMNSSGSKAEEDLSVLIQVLEQNPHLLTIPPVESPPYVSMAAVQIANDKQKYKSIGRSVVTGFGNVITWRDPKTQIVYTGVSIPKKDNDKVIENVVMKACLVFDKIDISSAKQLNKLAQSYVDKNTAFPEEFTSKIIQTADGVVVKIEGDVGMKHVNGSVYEGSVVRKITAYCGELQQSLDKKFLMRIYMDPMEEEWSQRLKFRLRNWMEAFRDVVLVIAIMVLGIVLYKMWIEKCK